VSKGSLALAHGVAALTNDDQRPIPLATGVRHSARIGHNSPQRRSRTTSSVTASCRQPCRPSWWTSTWPPPSG